MPFVLCARMGPRNYVLDGSPETPMGRGNSEGERAVHSKVYGRSDVNCAQTGGPIIVIYNDLYVCDVFSRKDVTFGSVVDNAAHLRVKSPKTSICHCKM